MKRMSGRELELQQLQANETLMRRNTTMCANIVMQRMGLDISRAGFIYRFDEDTNEASEFVFDGKKCKSFNHPLEMRSELPFDPYNNVKLCCGLLQYYINEYLKRDTNMIFLSNKNMNDNGSLTVIFDDGVRVTGNIYNKDTLKYIDMIFLLDGALPMEFADVKSMDLDAYSAQ